MFTDIMLDLSASLSFTASLICLKHLKSSEGITVESSNDSQLLFDGVTFDSDASLCRYIARSFPAYNLYGSSSLQYLEVTYSIQRRPLMENSDVIRTNVA